MTVSRRSLLFRLFPGLAGGAATAAMPAVAAASTVDSVQKVVYHLSEPTRINFVMGNIRNHIAGKGGPDKIRIVLVIHGPALEAFVRTKSTLGTGCTLSAGIAANLALGRTLEESIGAAKDFVFEAIRTAPKIGRGHSPVNHLLRTA